MFMLPKLVQNRNISVSVAVSARNNRTSGENIYSISNAVGEHEIHICPKRMEGGVGPCGRTGAMSATPPPPLHSSGAPSSSLFPSSSSSSSHASLSVDPQRSVQQAAEHPTNASAFVSLNSSPPSSSSTSSHLPRFWWLYMVIPLIAVVLVLFAVFALRFWRARQRLLADKRKKQEWVARMREQWTASRAHHARLVAAYWEHQQQQQREREGDGGLNGNDVEGLPAVTLARILRLAEETDPTDEDTNEVLMRIIDHERLLPRDRAGGESGGLFPVALEAVPPLHPFLSSTAHGMSDDTPQVSVVGQVRRHHRYHPEMESLTGSFVFYQLEEEGITFEDRMEMAGLSATCLYGNALYGLPSSRSSFAAASRTSLHHDQPPPQPHLHPQCGGGEQLKPQGHDDEGEKHLPAHTSSPSTTATPTLVQGHGLQQQRLAGHSSSCRSSPLPYPPCMGGGLATATTEENSPKDSMKYMPSTSTSATTKTRKTIPTTTTTPLVSGTAAAAAIAQEATKRPSASVLSTVEVQPQQNVHHSNTSNRCFTSPLSLLSPMGHSPMSIASGRHSSLLATILPAVGHGADSPSRPRQPLDPTTTTTTAAARALEDDKECGVEWLHHHHHHRRRHRHGSCSCSSASPEPRPSHPAMRALPHPPSSPSCFIICCSPSPSRSPSPSTRVALAASAAAVTADPHTGTGVASLTPVAFGSPFSNTGLIDLFSSPRPALTAVEPAPQSPLHQAGWSFPSSSVAVEDTPCDGMMNVSLYLEQHRNCTAVDEPAATSAAPPSAGSCPLSIHHSREKGNAAQPSETNTDTPTGPQKEIREPRGPHTAADPKKQKLSTMKDVSPILMPSSSSSSSSATKPHSGEKPPTPLSIASPIIIATPLPTIATRRRSSLGVDVDGEQRRRATTTKAKAAITEDSPLVVNTLQEKRVEKNGDGEVAAEDKDPERMVEWRIMEDRGGSSADLASLHNERLLPETQLPIKRREPSREPTTRIRCFSPPREAGAAALAAGQAPQPKQQIQE